MRNPSEKEEIQKELVLKNCFECMVKNGIEETSIREFSKATGMTASSLYYWFNNKDEIVLEATEYGIRVIIDQFFDFAMQHVKNVEKMCFEIQEKAKNYQTSLKTVFQVVASPKYGLKMAEVSEHISILFDVYAKKISGQLDMPYAKARTMIDLFISAVEDGVLWGQWDKLSKEIEFLLSMTVCESKEDNDG